MDWFIRDAMDEDRPDLIEMMAALQAYEAAIELNRRAPVEMAEPHFAALERWSSRSGGGVIVAAEPGRRPFAFLVWGVEESFGCFVAPENQRYAMISDLYVAEPMRGGGVGRELLIEAEERAAEIGLARIEIGSLSANTAARAAYAACGFQEESVSLSKPLRRRGHGHGHGH